MFNVPTLDYLSPELNDKRLTKRFNIVLSQLKTDTSGSIPQAAKNKGATKGVYRFFHNPKVNPSKLIAGHLKDLKVTREKEGRTRLLCLSDSTELDFTGKRSAANLGPLTFKERRGLILHNSIITNDLGVPIGLMKQDYILRSDEDFAKPKLRRNLPLEEKETFKWLNHFRTAQDFGESKNVEMVFIADRESDIIDVFHARNSENMHFIIRSRHNRRLANNSSKLRTVLDQQSVSSTYQTNVLHPKTLKLRPILLEVKFTPVILKLGTRSKCKKHIGPVKVNVVEVKEVNPPEEIEKPIHWILLTSLPINDLKKALQCVKYYKLRWIIERFHFLLKSGGAKIEDLQLERPHQLKNAITTYSIIVMDVLKIKYLAENQPDTSIHEIGITPLEHKVLYTYVNKRVNRKIVFNKDKIPTVWEFSRVLGLVGGFIPSKRRPIPGLKILTRALEEFYIILATYQTFFQNE